MSDFVKAHIIEKFLKKEFGSKKQYIQNVQLEKTQKGVELYGYKGAVVLVKDCGTHIEFDAKRS